MKSDKRVSLILVALSTVALSAPVLAANALAEKVSRLLVMDLHANAVDPATVKTIQGLLVDEISQLSDKQVLSGDDLRRVLEIQNNKNLMGCDDDGCMAEIAGALGAEQVIYGSLGQLDELYILQLVLFDATNIQVIRRANIKEKKLGQIPDRLPALVKQLLSGEVETQLAIKAKPHPNTKTLSTKSTTQKPSTKPQPAQWPRYTLYGAGGLSLIASMASATLALMRGYFPLQKNLDAIQTAQANNNISAASKQQDLADKNRKTTWTYAGISVGTAVLGLGLVLTPILFFSDSESAERTVQGNIK